MLTFEASKWFYDNVLKTKSFFGKSDYLPFGLRPNAEVEQDTPYFKTTIQINSLGYRDKEFSIKKPVGVFRILCLGDSFTFGSGVALEETYPKTLERSLNAKKPHRPIEVINAGFASGDSTDTAYLYLKNDGLKLSPDLVVLGFLPRGDIDEMMERDSVRSQFDESGLPVKIRGKHFDPYFINPKKAENPSLRHRVTTWLRRTVPGWDSFLARLDARFPILRRRASIGQTWLPGISKVFQVTPYSSEMESAWAYFGKLIGAMKALCAKQNCPFILMVIPSNFQCGKEYWRELGCAIKEDIYMQSRPQAVARHWSETHNVPFLDLIPPLRMHPDHPLFYPIDGHPNVAGHRAIGEQMSIFLWPMITEIMNRNRPIKPSELERDLV